MPGEPTHLTLIVDAGSDTDYQERSELTRLLRQHLLEGPVDDVQLVRSGSAPIGAKGDPVSLSTLSVTLAPIAAAAVMSILQSWLSRDGWPGL